MDKTRLEASVGLSRKWDAREAGREVARSTIEKLNHPPSFFLLFSTIHYKNYGGFQALLDGVWEVLPEGTPLIGGTVAGFINNYGCYARGASALAVSYPNIDVAIGLGKNAKITPKTAAIKCAKMVKSGLKNSKYKNKFLISMISDGKMPKLPFRGETNVVKSKIFGEIFSHIILRIAPYFGYGVPREIEILNKMTALLPEYYLIGGNSADDGRFIDNYQFVGDKICTNSVIALGCSIDLPLFLDSCVGLDKTDKTFTITDTAFGNYIISKIENKPAKTYLFREILGLSEEQIKEIGAFYYKLTYYFPITYEENDDYITGFGAVFGKNIMMGHEIKGKHVRILSATGKGVLDNIDRILPSDKNNFPFVFMFSSVIYSLILRNRSFEIKDRLDECLQDTPYLMAQPMIEYMRIPGRDPIVRVWSHNALSISNKNY